MTRSAALGAVLLVAGVLILLYRVSVDGFALSFWLLLAVLCIADGVIRLLLTRPEQ